VAIDLGVLTDIGLKKSMADYLGLPEMATDSIVDLTDECTSVIPKRYAIENRIVPVDVTAKEIKVAISEPTALRSIGGAKLISGKAVSAVVISPAEMTSLLAYIKGESQSIRVKTVLPPEPTIDKNVVVAQAPAPISASIEELSKTNKKAVPDKNISDKVVKKLSEDLPASKKEVAQDIELRDTKSQESKKIKTEEPAGQVIPFVNQIIHDAVKIGASDIHIEPYKNSASLRYRIDGVLHEQTKMCPFLFSNYAAVSTRIKIMSMLDIAERRLPQDGAIVTHLPDGRDIDLRVSVLPTVFGERILDRSGISFELDKIGLPEDQYQMVTSAVDAAQGMVLVTGPTGSGKSTTLYGVLKRLNKPDVNILTAEDPVEFTLEGVGQVHVKEDIGLGFSQALRSFLRQDPEVILVGEIRDKDTADISIKAALTGHLVLSTLHANDAISTVVRLINMGIPGYLIGAALTLVVAQRLARRICPHCKTIDEKDNVGLLISYGFSKEEASQVQVCHGKGCPNCNHTGYKGRQGIYEVLKISEELRAAIIDEESATKLKEIAIREGYRTMQEIGRDMIAKGTLTLDEYQRNLVFG
jgi:type IV pilus assembly protein PilB